MILRTILFLTLLFLAVFAETSFTFAATSKNQFNIYVSGLKVGELDYTVNQTGSRYSIKAIMKSTGVVSIFAKYLFDGRAVGSLKNGRYFPQQYSENSDTGKRKSNKEMTYEKGMPQIIKGEKRKSYWLAPASQNDTVDPMTAIHALLSDQSSKTPCKQNMVVYDGARRFSIKLLSSTINNQNMSCKGIFTRIGGYSKKEWAQGTQFPFELKYVALGNIFRLERFIMTTLRGRASFVRR
ncbi:MAG: hypothetical protein CML56_09775 [Rhodobacteraceae bacterium]|nr:hypothetical protein [Paracoccaceae bacterium]